ncbi:MAG: CDP-glycerol glycerophosphotransferase family protein [Candidatus Sungbacteria bacterium]|uniref:CDP-glycerol glycerophosphotransferase family protein n=1 Tax=Candidatus Sungiibacteriota bacterium TaxID=2750080 RepID=A0A932YY44_9BACT|nr:CDP-glycerol glycerophosphotransferase family protein [Candidatus Sungbacteria bacterium]
MRTIFITIFQGIEAKNILRTGIVERLLAEPDVRLVCFVRSEERAAYYRREVPHERLVYEPFGRSPYGRFERLMSFLKFHLIRTKTTNLKKRMHLERSGNWPLFVVSHALNWLMARPAVRSFLRPLDLRFVGDPGFGPYFERYRPRAVFLAHLFDDVEIALLREARRRGVPTVGYINSWDKVTTRASLRLLPDTLLVFNDIVKDEVIRYADMRPERVIPAGIPQYDRYVTARSGSREEFFRRIGIDPSKRLIVYAPMGRTFSDSDWEMIDILHSAIESGRIGPDAALLVRFQPNDFIDEEELKRRPHLRYDIPGIRFGRERSVDWDMGFEELAHLTDTLAHLSVLVCYASSIAIDAAIFGKPTVGIAFEVKQQLLARSPTQYYRTEHYAKAVATGGIRLAKSERELIAAINAYLADPSLDREKRERLIKAQCWRVDGKAGERIADHILAVVKS